MARRGPLNGEQSWERIEKTNHQRDYAAQLQEQIKQKEEMKIREKKLLLREQEEELKLLHELQSNSTISKNLSPTKRQNSIPHASPPTAPVENTQYHPQLARNSLSNMESNLSTKETMQSTVKEYQNETLKQSDLSKTTESSLRYTNTSIFESLLQDELNNKNLPTKFDNELLKLQNLRLEIETEWQTYFSFATNLHLTTKTTNNFGQKSPQNVVNPAPLRESNEQANSMSYGIGIATDKIPLDSPLHDGQSANINSRNLKCDSKFVAIPENNL